MKKCSFILGILVILFGIVFMGTRDVMAANTEPDEIEQFFIDDSDVNSTPSTNTNKNNSNNTNTTKNNTNTNTNATKNNTNTNATKNNTNINANNVSNYNNTNNTPNSLSKAGLEDSIPTMVLIVIFAISAIYAFKKINEYKNV